MSEWYESAPLLTDQPSQQTNWWESAPEYEEPDLSDIFTGEYKSPDAGGELDATEVAEYMRTSGWNIPFLTELEKEVSAGLSMGMNEISSTFARSIGLKQEAEKKLRRADVHSQAVEQLHADSDISPLIRRGVRGTVRSLTHAVPAAVGGLPGIIGMSATVRTNRALKEADDAGLTGAKRLIYAGGAGAIEGTVTAIFSKLGMGGVESQLLAKNVTNAGLKEGFKQIGKSVLHEVPEEVIIETMDASLQSISGVDPTAATPENLVENLKQTVVTTLMTVGTVGGAQIASQAIDTQEPVADYSLQPGEVMAPESQIPPEAAGEPPVVFSETADPQLLSEREAQLAKMEAEGFVPELDPKMMTQAIDESYGRRLAEWETMQPVRDIKKKHFNIIQTLRNKDPDAVKRFDELASEWISDNPGFAQDAGELAELLKAGPDLKPNRNDPDILREASEIAEENLTAFSPEMFDDAIFFTPPGGFKGDLGKLAQSAKSTARKLLTTRGHLPEQVFSEKVRKEGRVASQLKQIEFTLADFDRTARQVYGGFRRMGPEKIKQLDSVLKGAAEESTIPAPMRPIIRKMRTEIDALSRKLIDTGVIEGNLAGVIEENIGVYANRSYKVFDDPKWAENVPETVRNKAKAFIRQEYPELSEDEVHGKIESLLYEGKAAESPIALIKSGKLGSKDLSILTKRKTIPPEIRALWGEHDDPRVNYGNSVSKMARLISNHQFLSQVKADGVGQFLYKKPVVNEQGEFKTRIAADASQVMFPLNGLYTTPEIKQAFEDALEPKVHGDLFRRYMLVNSTVKLSKTVLSVMTHIRNLFGNTGFAVANGHWRVGKAQGAFKATMTGLAKLNDAEYRSYFRHLQELGVVEEGARAGELRDVVRDASRADLDGYAEKSILRRAGKLAVGVYQAEDNVWKVYAFENEKARYSKAFPEKSEQEIEQIAATNVRNTYPTYSMIPEGVKKIRRFPMIGTFVSFPSEVMRTGYHTIKLAKTELQDPKTRSIGAQRLAGISVAATATAAIATASRFLMGVTGDDDEDLREFVAPWNENSQLVHLGKTPDGKYRYIDLSYTDPYEYLKKPVTAMMRGDDWEESLWEATVQAAEPFVGEEILAEKLLDISRNKKANGGTVFNEQDDVLKRRMDQLAHIYGALEPGTLSSARRIASGISGTVNAYGGSYNPKLEATAVFTGQRIIEIDISQALMFKAREFSREFSEANRIFGKVVHSKGDVTEQEIREAYQSSDKSRRKLFENIHKKTQAAIRLGLTGRQVLGALRTAHISSGVAKRIIGGQYQSYVPQSVPTKRRNLTASLARESSK